MISAWVGAGAAGAAGAEDWGAVAERAGAASRTAASHDVRDTRPLLVFIQDLTS
jgi:hypothetical protein